ncbi:MAG: bifunctional phosphoribosylaminoimidazolecarboxamide formyltransferase/IMP cyclohydrolase [Treponema sp.]|nr:bifunctional phosphoribosylaminoimidazolecarboxamide formyltransferase/IMP cyclohydrolase [Treponema sp.]
MKKRALLSVFNKDGILDLASFLIEGGWEIISTGGTAKYLSDNKLPVTDVAAITGFPECLDGRVKTLHPAIHAGLLARREEPYHMETLKELRFGTIDLLCVNLYPFFEKSGEGLSFEDTIEFIDIGGPAMLRSAAKNFCDLIVLCESADYAEAMEGIRTGNMPIEFRKVLAAKVFTMTSAYDAAIARYLMADEAETDYPAFLPLSQKKSQLLRYGENSHQSAALYLNTGKWGALACMEQLHGKELGYNNIRDLDLAWKAACSEAERPCCAAVKHNSPCGMALGENLEEAFDKVFACDPVSIFGGIVACTVKVDTATAEKLAELFLEIVVAPEFDPDALEILKKKKNLRIMKAGKAPSDTKEYISVDGGLLVQEVDNQLFEKWEFVTRAVPSMEDTTNLLFGLRAVSFVKSNAIVAVKDLATTGIGGGQVNRIWAAEQALERSAAAIKAAADKAAQTGSGPWADGQPARILASDAFFPFPDVVEAAAAAGIKAIVQPGGSVNDSASIEACDRLGLAMVFTGTRHFKH